MTIGQKVWYVGRRGYRDKDAGREYVIIKIARKWITMAETMEGHEWSNIRVDRNQPRASQNGYWAHDTRGDVVGTVYENREHEKYTEDRRAAWERVERYVRHLPYAPDHVTLSDIQAIAKILEVNLDEPAST